MHFCTSWKALWTLACLLHEVPPVLYKGYALQLSNVWKLLSYVALGIRMFGHTSFIWFFGQILDETHPIETDSPLLGLRQRQWASDWEKGASIATQLLLLHPLASPIVMAMSLWQFLLSSIVQCFRITIPLEHHFIISGFTRKHDPLLSYDSDWSFWFSGSHVQYLLTRSQSTLGGDPS